MKHLVLVSGRGVYALVQWYDEDFEKAQEVFRNDTGLTPTYIFNIK